MEIDKLLTIGWESIDGSPYYYKMECECDKGLVFLLSDTKRVWKCELTHEEVVKIFNEENENIVIDRELSIYKKIKDIKEKENSKIVVAPKKVLESLSPEKSNEMHVRLKIKMLNSKFFFTFKCKETIKESELLYQHVTAPLLRAMTVLQQQRNDMIQYADPHIPRDITTYFDQRKVGFEKNGLELFEIDMGEHYHKINVQVMEMEKRRREKEEERKQKEKQERERYERERNETRTKDHDVVNDIDDDDDDEFDQEENTGGEYVMTENEKKRARDILNKIDRMRERKKRKKEDLSKDYIKNII